MPSYPSSNREAIGPYDSKTLVYSMESGAAAADLANMGGDNATIAVKLYECPLPGWVRAMSITGVGGNIVACTFVVQVETVAIAASALAIANSLNGYITYKPGAVPFIAGNSLAVELDVLTTTMRDCVVHLDIVENIAAGL